MERLDSGPPRAPRVRRPGRARRLKRAVLLTVVVGVLVVTVPVMPKEPLGRPPVVATGQGVHEFSMRQPGGGDPVAYDPCEPIQYVVVDELAGPSAIARNRPASVELGLGCGGG